MGPGFKGSHEVNTPLVLHPYFNSNASVAVSTSCVDVTITNVTLDVHRGLIIVTTIV